ncbi:hypothetical protein F0919_07650 [Taibaiella lutea]|uniref:Nucleotide exchange factor GrpE n=1 Tax=Taibaiella lutea TaxID=2608001 RepID=A0A5M6CHG1_9BACT|nr:hypothetical protein [Taibaiella lutea]KAA5534487.1 hypothetical protein F0919_07650 [Taibaiella lutea]
MQHTLAIINQVFEIKQKLEQDNLAGKFERNFNRLFSAFEEEGYTCNNPLGERYTDSRSDCTANIVGRESKNMMITQVIKPIIYQKENGALTLIQKGIVIVESK